LIFSLLNPEPDKSNPLLAKQQSGDLSFMPRTARQYTAFSENQKSVFVVGKYKSAMFAQLL
jgi:hypothetical protein